MLKLTFLLFKKTMQFSFHYNILREFLDNSTTRKGIM